MDPAPPPPPLLLPPKPTPLPPLVKPMPPPEFALPPEAVFPEEPGGPAWSDFELPHAESAKSALTEAHPSATRRRMRLVNHASAQAERYAQSAAHDSANP